MRNNTNRGFEENERVQRNQIAIVETALIASKGEAVLIINGQKI